MGGFSGDLGWGSRVVSEKQKIGVTSAEEVCGHSLAYLSPIHVPKLELDRKFD